MPDGPVGDVHLQSTMWGNVPLPSLTFAPSLSFNQGEFEVACILPLIQHLEPSQAMWLHKSHSSRDDRGLLVNKMNAALPVWIPGEAEVSQWGTGWTHTPICTHTLSLLSHCPSGEVLTQVMTGEKVQRRGRDTAQMLELLSPHRPTLGCLHLVECSRGSYISLLAKVSWRWFVSELWERRASAS